MTEYCKVERVEKGVAIVTARIPVEYLEPIMDLATHIINSARFLKIRSRVHIAEDLAVLRRSAGLKG